MKKRIVKVMVFILSICAIVPAVAAMAHVDRGTDQQLNARKGGPVNPIEARKGGPVNPIEARKDGPVKPIE
jgi:hypothetical protein